MKDQYNILMLVKYIVFGREGNKTADKLIERKYSNEIVYWRNVFKRIIRIILSLTSGNTTLRQKKN